MKKIKLFLDGREIEATAGQTILEAALAANHYIPHICSHPDLIAQGGCGLCVVEIDGLDGPVTSCETAAKEGMRVTTKSEKLSHMRSVAMELMLAGHPPDCTSCKVYLKCEFQALMQYLGSVHSRMRTIRRETDDINLKNPLIVREMERCIQCGRCVSACKDLRKVGILEYNRKDGETYISTLNDLPLADAQCVFCGACVEVCPTGALQDEEGVFRTDLPRRQALVPCQADCPAGIDISLYTRLVKEGNSGDAHGVIRERVPFPHVLGHVCHHPCESACKRTKLNDPVSIRALKRYAVEHDEKRAWYDLAIAPLHKKTGKRVAVVGSGPCGLTAAMYLRKKGHEVTVLERHPMAGGMMTTGIPEYRVPLEDVKKEIDVIAAAGVEIKTGFEVKNVPELKSRYDAVLVATGASRGKKLSSVPGWDLKGTHTAIDVLQARRLGHDMELGGTVNIIGGGNVAYDCARTLLRLGKKVNIICLEKSGAMLADLEEIEEAREEGAVLYDGASTVCIEGKGGRVTGHRIADVKEFLFDENGRLEVRIHERSQRTIPCDSLVFAAGQATGLTEEFGLKLNRFGYPVNPDTGKSELKTSVEGVFAAGDVLTGTRFVIEAIAAGRHAAEEIDRYLGGDGDISEVLVPKAKRDPAIGRIENFAALPREEAAVREVGERLGSFCPVSDSFTDEQAVREAIRCLQCDLRKDISHVPMWTEYAN